MVKSRRAQEAIQNPRTSLGLGVVGLILTYALATRSIDTGSLQQYGLTILVFILSIGLFVKAGRLSL